MPEYSNLPNNFETLGIKYLIRVFWFKSAIDCRIDFPKQLYCVLDLYLVVKQVLN